MGWDGEARNKWGAWANPPLPQCREGASGPITLKVYMCLPIGAVCVRVRVRVVSIGALPWFARMHGAGPEHPQTQTQTQTDRILMHVLTFVIPRADRRYRRFPTKAGNLKGPVTSDRQNSHIHYTAHIHMYVHNTYRRQAHVRAETCRGLACTCPRA